MESAEHSLPEYSEFFLFVSLFLLDGMVACPGCALPHD